MLPLAPAVNPIDDAKTLKPALVGATATLQGVAAVELPGNRDAVVPSPLPPTAAPSIYQKEYRGDPAGDHPTCDKVIGA